LLREIPALATLGRDDIKRRFRAQRQPNPTSRPAPVSSPPWKAPSATTPSRTPNPNVLDTQASAPLFAVTPPPRAQNQHDPF